jgi:hypothetical protein
MNPNEAEQFIAAQISVTRQKVTIAKAFAIERPTGDSHSLISAFLTEMDATMPQEVVIHQSVDPIPTLTKVAESFSWRLAMCEAIWGLIHANIFIPTDFNMVNQVWSVSWTTIVPGSGGTSAGWDFSRYRVDVPGHFRLAPSQQIGQEQTLTDGDLYIRDLGIPSIHPEAEEALRDAVKCFRFELYTPALAMLAKASEGAWYELGIALTRALPAAAKPTADKNAREFNDPWVSVAKKIQLVLKLYEHSGLQPVKEHSGVDDNDLKQALVWSDVVRESRNVVHYGVQPPTANTYEKVAAVLIGAIPHLRILYRVYNAAEAVSKENEAAVAG